MKTHWTIGLAVVAVVAGAAAAAAQQDAGPPAPQDSGCITCHGESQLWDADNRNYFVTQEDLAHDVHWQKGIRCHDCHGGDPQSLNFRQAHAADAGYHVIESPRDIPQFCGRCHSDVEYMGRFQPSPKTSQQTDYWTSGHGRRLKDDPTADVATCVSCHGRHGIRSVKDLDAPVYPTNVAKTCATCHADAEKMADIQYHGRPIGHDQFQQWSTSVHAELLLKRGDLSAATCNDCHGDHATVAPDARSVSRVCSSCHVRIGQLFDQTAMKHRFEEASLPGCATCHGSHAISHPTDQMLGMGEGAVCADCHAEGRYGATLAGAEQARQMRAALDKLKEQIKLSVAKLDHAERLGMDVRQARFRLRDARQALPNARVQIHSFALDPVQSTIAEGLRITAQVDEQAEAALDAYTFRRIWLGVSLVPIALAIGMLLLWIRTLPPPERPGP